MAPSERVYITHRLNSISFTLEEQFTPIELLGKGAFGAVCAAIHSSGEIVAIKKISGAFDEEATRFDAAKRTLREIQLLRHLKHENVIGLRRLLLSPDGRDAYLVTDRMDSDMAKVIDSKQQLSDDHLKYFLYQMLCGLAYVHSAGVVHRDLKPANVLLNANCELKISDFGLARSIDEDEAALTQYVVTRWYRAPEILLLARTYTKAVDVWSVACIFAELLRRRALFAGRDPVHQLSLITSLLGTPAIDELNGVDEKLVHALSSLPRKPPLPLRSAVPNASEAGLDLLQQMLTFDAKQRISAAGALRHPFLASLHDGEPETAEAAESTPFSLEHQDLDWPSIRALVATEVRLLATASGMQLDEPRRGGCSHCTCAAGTAAAAAASSTTKASAESATPSTHLAQGLQRAAISNDHSAECAADDNRHGEGVKVACGAPAFASAFVDAAPGGVERESKRPKR